MTSTGLSRRRFVGLMGALGVGAVGGSIGLSGCGGSNGSGSSNSNGDNTSGDLDLSNWDAVLEAAKGTTVSYYGYGEETVLNNWFDVTYAQHLKDTYDITLKRTNAGCVVQNSTLTSEKEAGVGKGEGSIDVIWTVGEYFNALKEGDMLWGSYAQYLPALEQYIDTSSVLLEMDGPYEIDGMETPAVNTPFVMFRDTSKTSFAPKNADEFLEFCKQNEGKVTYAAIANGDESVYWFAGIAGDILGYDWWEDCENTYDAIKEKLEPVLSFFRDLNPYLWMQGQNFPETMDALYKLYADGEIVMAYTGYPLSVGQHVEDGTYPATTESFCFESGVPCYLDYYSIPYSVPNLAGALVVINDMLTADTQISRMSAGYMPFLDSTKLSDAEREEYENAALEADAGTGAVIDINYMSERFKPTILSSMHDNIYQIWQNEVVGKTNS